MQGCVDHCRSVAEECQGLTFLTSQLRIYQRRQRDAEQLLEDGCNNPGKRYVGFRDRETKLASLWQLEIMHYVAKAQRG